MVRHAEALGVAVPRRQPLLEQHGGDDDDSLEELLLRDGAVVEDEDVVERGEDQDAEDGADDGAPAAGEQRAADDDRGDRVELVEVAVGGATGGGPGDQHQGGDAAADADEHVEVDGLPLDRDAGEAGGLGVAADGDSAAAEGRPVEQDPADDRDQDEDPDLHRDPDDLPVEEVGEAFDVDDLGLAITDDLGQAPGAGQHREGHDERHYPAVGDQQPVDQPAAGADRQRDEHHDEPVGVIGHRLGGDRGAPDRRQRDDRSDREVDAAADDHERHPDADDADRRRQLEDRQGVGGGREAVTGRDDPDEAQQQQRYDEAEVAAHARTQQGEALVGLAGGLQCGPLDAHAVLAHAGTFPSMTRSRTRASSRSVAADSWTTSPSRTTRTRSASPSTSSISLDTTTTATPRSASDRTSW